MYTETKHDKLVIATYYIKNTLKMYESFQG